MKLDKDDFPHEPEVFILLNQKREKETNLQAKYADLPSNLVIIEVDSKNTFEGNAKELKALSSFAFPSKVFFESTSMITRLDGRSAYFACKLVSFSLF